MYHQKHLYSICRDELRILYNEIENFVVSLQRITKIINYRYVQEERIQYTYGKNR